MVSIVKKENEAQFYNDMNKYITSNFKNWRFMFVPADNKGAIVL